MPPTSKSRTTTTRPPALVTGMRSALCLGLLQDWDPRLALPPSGRILLEALQRNAEAFGELMVELPTVNARGTGSTFLGLSVGGYGLLLIGAGGFSLLQGDWSAVTTIAVGILALAAGWEVIRVTFTRRKSTLLKPL